MRLLLPVEALSPAARYASDSSPRFDTLLLMPLDIITR